ncbi:PAS domain S-box protein [Fulvivirga sp. M361]|uniref:PAS domain-containing sensor histidine kinase n=1 Tax=Fulvivirga sp. M361 TaxID=2594266 RepID=UPI001179F2D9|nr:PAS domain-containing sensor histidine kinase [Fulvivirga sp. M361]TRX52676.1 PAS domain S-box protein [Fulvivirga sp. M361]
MNRERTFKVIFETCQEGILVINDQGIIVLANKSCSDMFGYEQGELIDKSIESLIPPSLRKAHVGMRKMYTSNPMPRQMGVGRELNGTKKDGSEFSVEVSLNQAILKNTTHTVAFVIDITERKKIELALKKSEAQLILYATELEHRVKERTEELDRTIQTLEKTNTNLEEQINVRIKAENEARKALERERELNELKSRFVSMASHEFRTPLSTILSSASLIERYSKPENEGKREKHVGKIKTAIGNLKEILDDFLSVSKLEEGRIGLNLTTVNASMIAEEVIDQVTPLCLSDQNIKLLIKGKEREFEADDKVIQIIFVNLISNGIKYSQRDIKVTLNYTEKNLKISIKDDGIGIPPEDQKHMFERFFRAKNATNIQGTGLGLNIVKKYVELLKGQISFQSKLGYGTTFTVNIPIV